MLTLTVAQWASICAHLTAHRPEEACGLLAGRAERVEKIYLITNVAQSPTRYEMAPAEVYAAILEMEAKDWELLGIFHSHPAGPAAPSPTDVAEAYYPDSAYLIFSPAPAGVEPDGWQARAFEIRGGAARDLPLTVVDG